MTFEESFSRDQTLIEQWLQDYLDSLWPFGKLVESMGYSLLAGGKRIRPVLTLAACRFCKGDVSVAMPLACALEMVHSYSLIHDDLPAMDDDQFRRGRPTNHRVYGEATAILAGDALLTAAFEVISKEERLKARQIVEAVRCLSEAAGPAGMVAGQVLDMEGEGKSLTFRQIEQIEALKTGKLIVAATELGAIAAGGEVRRREALRSYASKLGLAFQIKDDILDHSGDEVELGKPTGSDLANEKRTFVSLKGEPFCLEMVESLTSEAIEAVRPYEESEFLCWLAEMLANRKK